MFNLLLDKLPKEFKGKAFNTDFRQVLKAFNLFKDEDLTDNEKTFIFVRIFFDSFDRNEINEYIEFLNWYILGADENKESEEEESVFDWEIDANYIYSAFKQVYNIDLSEVNMHWWRFISLFNGLPEGTKLSEIIKIRTMEIPKQTKENIKQISAIKKAKNFFALNKENSKKSVGTQLQDIWGAI